jgi:hypothetical protein
MPSRCRMPRENPPLRRLATPASPTSCRTSATRRRGRPLLAASADRCAAAVHVAGVQPHAGVAQPGDPAGEGAADDGGAARGGAEAEDHPQRRGLAGPVRAEEPVHVAGPDVNVRLFTAMTWP